MSRPQGSGFPFAKIVVVLALALIAGLGLCGLDYLLASRGIGKSTQEFGVGPLDGISLVVMFLSACGLVIMLIAWMVGAAIGSFGRGPDSEPQELFDDKDDTNSPK